MKNICTFYSALFLFIFFLASNSAFSQKGLFVDGELSIVPIPSFFIGQVSVTSGYRFNRNIAVGLEYRGAGSVDRDVHVRNMQGIGLTFRFAKDLFIAKLTQGMVLSAHMDDEDLYYIEEYTGGGFYNSIFLGARFRSGFLLGGTVTLARKTKFTKEFNDPDIINDTNFDILYLPYIDSSVSMFFVGVTVGVTFPREIRW